jgi:transposase
VAENSLLTNLTGPERDDDRRIISGIIHMLQCGARWRDCPPEYGHTTISNRWEHEQAIGRSRGGRTTKIHALTDPDCRPCAFHLTPGQEADIVAAPALLALAPPMCALIADNPRRHRQPRCNACHPKQVQQNSSPPFQQARLQGRNVIERCFCPLKDFRRIAARYDKLARNFLAAIQLAAVVAYWINWLWTLSLKTQLIDGNRSRHWRCRLHRQPHL